MKYLALLLFYISQINSDIYFVEENKILHERCKLIRTVEYQEKYWTAKRKDEYYKTRCKEDNIVLMLILAIEKIIKVKFITYIIV